MLIFSRSFFIYNLIDLLVYFGLNWVFGALSGLSLVAESEACPNCGAWASHCGGFSCCEAQALGPQALGPQASVAAFPRL